MNLLEYDLGLHISHLAMPLRTLGVVRIIGYSRSGKSTLSEIFKNEIEDSGHKVLLQNAARWIQNPQKSLLKNTHEPGNCVDPELAESIVYLEKHDCSYWIIDDAEILIAYASETYLRAIAKKIQSRSFFLILIRNRFVNEQTGWFKSKECLINPEMPKIFLRPLRDQFVIDAVRQTLQRDSNMSKINWLVKMSGGIPGLIHDLAPFAVDNEGIRSDLLIYAQLKFFHYKLNDPVRWTLIKAIDEHVLPPIQMLKLNAQIEIGNLKALGIIQDDYAWSKTPFYSDFWRTVIGTKFSVKNIPDSIVELALELAILIDEIGMTQDFIEFLDLEHVEQAELATAFALCLFAEQEIPDYIRSLAEIIAENLGRIQLLSVLKKRNIMQVSTNLDIISLSNTLIKSFSKS